MKKLVLFAVLCLAFPMVLATYMDAQYLTVMKSDAPMTDAITATDFAAQMQAQAKVTFSAVTDEKLSEVESLQTKLLVYIDGKTAKIVTPVGASEREAAVAKLALNWLEDQKMTVEIVDKLPAARTDGAATKPKDETSKPPVTPETPKTTAEEKKCTGCEENGVCVQVGEKIGEKVCLPDKTLAIKRSIGGTCAANGDCASGLCKDSKCTTPQSAPAAETVKKPGIFARFFGWLKGLFS